MSDPANILILLLTLALIVLYARLVCWAVERVERHIYRRHVVRAAVKRMGL